MHPGPRGGDSQGEVVLRPLLVTSFGCPARRTGVLLLPSVAAVRTLVMGETFTTLLVLTARIGTSSRHSGGPPSSSGLDK